MQHLVPFYSVVHPKKTRYHIHRAVVSLLILASLILKWNTPHAKLNWKEIPKELKTIHWKNITHKEVQNLPVIDYFIKPVFNIRIFMTPEIHVNDDKKYPGSRLIQSQATLHNVSDWFWIHNEYKADHYMVKRAQQDTRLFTRNIEEADLCYPACSVKPRILKSQKITFEVQAQSRYKFAGCSQIEIGIETPMTKCTFPVQYWHSVYFPENSSSTPWNIATERPNLLCFTGGSWRGYGRDHIIAEMQVMSKIFSKDDHQLFEVDYSFTSQKEEGTAWGAERFYQRVWELYARSVFSWQPPGDSQTRRGFYDSWMLGCIPVISRHSADTYKNLFRGYLFSTIGPEIQNVVVVLDNNVMMSGAAIIESLAAISASEIRTRQRWLKRLAPLMQWGWDQGEKRSPDALLMALAAVMKVQEKKNQLNPYHT